MMPSHRVTNLWPDLFLLLGLVCFRRVLFVGTAVLKFHLLGICTEVVDIVLGLVSKEQLQPPLCHHHPRT
ncbi:hypothetical protein BDZ94DRAFT_1252812 [Collybia nuda]|uniref:Uncharacterized protein n=1 Tax=Collybia nuda TaxID=64659 RepID=A0A9P5YC22_9AGAR|nr:hypothetical protein BDZ94DRAFT_1252812 [Collybia nuda]